MDVATIVNPNKIRSGARWQPLGDRNGQRENHEHGNGRFGEALPRAHEAVQVDIVDIDIWDSSHYEGIGLLVYYEVTGSQDTEGLADGEDEGCRLFESRGLHEQRPQLPDALAFANKVESTRQHGTRGCAPVLRGHGQLYTLAKVRLSGNFLLLGFLEQILVALYTVPILDQVLYGAGDVAPPASHETGSAYLAKVPVVLVAIDMSIGYILVLEPFLKLVPCVNM